MQESAQGPVVVITGASAGIGRAAAREFARRRARVALLARGQDGLEAARYEVESLGGEALCMRVDVAVAEDVFEAADRIEEQLGPIDVWVNNAMTTVFSPVSKLSPEEVRRVTDVTYLGQVHGTMAALRHMAPRDRGVIVSVGSALAYRGIPLQAAYCAAKHAVHGFLESLRCELIHDGSRVHITEVHLPGMNTPQFEWSESHMENEPQPVPPIYQPEVAARAIVWAAEHRRRELFVGLPVYKTVWGNKLFPGFLDHYLAKNAYIGQLLDERSSPDRPSNLYEPVAGDYGAHGRFDQRAHDHSPIARVGAALGAPATARLLVGLSLLGMAAFAGRELGRRRARRR